MLRNSLSIRSSMAPPLVPRWHRPTRYFIAHTVGEVLMIERQPLRLRDLFYVARSLLLVGRVDQRLVADARLLFSKERATALMTFHGKVFGFGLAAPRARAASLPLVMTHGPCA